MKVYTKTGDKGMTSLIGGERVFKTDERVEAYGTVDELAAFTALLADNMRGDAALASSVGDLNRILSRLMSVEALLATGQSGSDKVAPLNPETVAWLEGRIDAMQEVLKPIDKFTIPGGNAVVSMCHVCRTVCRRAERAALRADARYGVDSTALVWLGVIAYSLQLYFDFSGYSMMAIGMGKMLGFDFPQNFNYPYISRSITEFWRRWHMTLSGWFREYVYIPLGGNRKGLKRQILNLFIVELLTGIWHGANWNFICWGLYYFVLLAIEKLFLLPHLKKGKVWPHIYTLFLVVVGWAMFVGNDTGVSFGLLFQKLFIPSGGVSPLYFLRNYGVLLIVSVICCTPLIEKIWNTLRRNVITRCATILLLLVVSTAYVVGSTNSPFLYFNF